MGCGQSEEKRAEKGGLREDPIFTIFRHLSASIRLVHPLHSDTLSLAISLSLCFKFRK